MGVLMMHVVNVGVVVLRRFVTVIMFMAFADVQPYSDSHQHGRNDK